MTVVATADIQLGIKGQGKQVSGLKESNKQLEEMKKSGKAASQGVGSLEKGMKALGAAGFVAGLAAGTAAIVELGAQAERTNTALNALTNNQAPQFINAVTTATRGTISDMQAATIATRAYGLNLVQTKDEAAEFARVATILGGTFKGIGAEQAAEEFALLLTNMSFLRLDTFGISAAKVRDRIKELKAETPGLSKEAAFVAATMEIASQKADTLGATMQGTAAEVDILKANISNLKNEFAATVSEAFTPAIKATNDLIAGFQMIEQASQEALQSLIDSAQSNQDLAAGLEVAHKQTRKAAIEQRALQIAQEKGVSTQIALSIAANEYRTNIEGFSESLREASRWEAETAREAQSLNDVFASGESIVDDFAESVEELVAQRKADEAATRREAAVIAAANEVFISHEDAVKKAADRQKELAAAQREAERVASEYLKVQESLAGAFDTLVGPMGYFGSEITQLELSTEGLRQVGEAWFDVLQATGAETLIAGDAYDQLRQKYGLVSEEQLKLEQGALLLGEAFKTGALGALEASDLFDQFVSGQIESVGALSQEIESMSGKVGDNFDAIRAAAAEGLVPQEDLDAIQGIDFETTNDGLRDINSTLTEQEETLASLQETAPNAFAAIAEAAPPLASALSPVNAALTSAKEAIAFMLENAVRTFTDMGAAVEAQAEVMGTVGGMIHGMRVDWEFLMKNANLHLKVVLEVVGDIGSQGYDSKASGGPASGLTLVGEEGPELVTLPGGSYVHDADSTKQMMSGASALSTSGMGGVSIGSISVNIMEARNGRQVFNEFAQELRARGFDINLLRATA